MSFCMFGFQTVALSFSFTKLLEFVLNTSFGQGLQLTN